MRIATCRIGFIGFGHMAEIMCQAIETSRLVPRSQIFFHRRDPSRIHWTQQTYGITSTSLENLVVQSDLILICVRPAHIDSVLISLKGLNLSGKTLVSILAGTEIAYFEKFLGSIAMVRAMPNEGLSVGEGMTTLSFNERVVVEARSHVNLLFKSMGEVVELSEKFMDLATGMAGSGPAFVFALIESLARLGEREGISYENALKMAAQTFLGAARILLGGDVSIPEELRKIAIPGGTTEAGLKVFKNLEIDNRLQAVVLAAAHRARELRGS